MGFPSAYRGIALAKALTVVVLMILAMSIISMRRHLISRRGIDFQACAADWAG